MSDLVDDKVVPAVVKEEIHSPDSDAKLFPSVVEEVCILDAFPPELVEGKEFPTVVKKDIYTLHSDGKLFSPAVEEVCDVEAFPSELVHGKEFPPVVKEEVYTLEAFPPELVDRKEFPPTVEEVCTPDALPSELVDGKDLLSKSHAQLSISMKKTDSLHLCIEAEEIDDVEYFTISGKRPYFNLVLAKSHINSPFQMTLPPKIVRVLPSAKVPVVLTSHGKRWRTCYLGDNVAKRFASSWRNFAFDNDLKVGDCCFFELMECNTRGLEFKVIIIRSQPIDGDTPQTAIVIE